MPPQRGLSPADPRIGGRGFLPVRFRLVLPRLPD